jgi:chromate transporter
MQLVTYMGWRLHGVRGGLLAGTLFVLPGFVSILALSLLYTALAGLPLLPALFFGIKAAVVAIVFQALLKIGRRTLTSRAKVFIAAAAFVAIFLFDVPFPLIVLSAALMGLLGAGRAGGTLHATAPVGGIAGLNSGGGWSGALSTLVLWSAIWLVPVLALAAWLGPDDVFTRLGVFFSQLALVTFGGAYAVLAYMAQEAVHTYHWLSPGEMLDGLGLAETTPGPLIQVVQFVGYIAAYRDPGVLPPAIAGVLASILVTWVTFTPCFLWIFLGAPYIDRLRSNHWLTSALSAVTAAVVGVILNLALWFSLHVAFTELTTWRYLGMRLLVPDLATISPGSVLITAVALVALLRFHAGMLPVLFASAVLGTAWWWLVGG